MNISQAVEIVVKGKPFVTEALAEGMLNISSLARRIKPQVSKMVQKEAKQGAIVMALNRLVPLLNEAAVTKSTQALSGLGDIIVRSNLSDYTFANSKTIVECHTKLLNQISDLNNSFYTMVRGVFESNIVVASGMSDLVETVFSKEQCTFRQHNLSAVTIKLPVDNEQACGFYYQIMKFIAWEGINVKEVISTTNEFSIIVTEEDVDKAFAILKNLKNIQELC